MTSKDTKSDRQDAKMKLQTSIEVQSDAYMCQESHHRNHKQLTQKTKKRVTGSIFQLCPAGHGLRLPLDRHDVKVPYDATLEDLFFGEESSMAVRLWTSGWDFFSPSKLIGYHLWTRKHRPKFQTVALGGTAQARGAVTGVCPRTVGYEAAGRHCVSRYRGFRPWFCPHLGGLRSFLWRILR